MSMKPLENIVNFKFNAYYIISTLYILTSFMLGLYLRNGLIIFLGWNMVLATIPLILASIFVHKKSNILRFGIAFLYLIFFPNTIYIMTDFIHFQNYTFFIEYPSVYAFHMYDWLVFTHIVIGALIGSKIGIMSLQMILNTFIKLKTYLRIFGVSLLFVLSSIAIFIGRFLRYNSWDIFKIGLIFTDITSHFAFFMQFVGITVILHLVIFAIFYEKKEPMAHIK